MKRSPGLHVQSSLYSIVADSQTVRVKTFMARKYFLFDGNSLRRKDIYGEKNLFFFMDKLLGEKMAMVIRSIILMEILLGIKTNMV